MQKAPINPINFIVQIFVIKTQKMQINYP